MMVKRAKYSLHVSSVERQTHNLKVVGENPIHAARQIAVQLPANKGIGVLFSAYMKAKPLILGSNPGSSARVTTLIGKGNRIDTLRRVSLTDIVFTYMTRAQREPPGRAQRVSTGYCNRYRFLYSSLL